MLANASEISGRHNGTRLPHRHSTGAISIPIDCSAPYVLTLCLFYTGHFVEARSQRCVALVGREVASERECTRDAEWKLLRLQLHDYESAASSELLAERTGGDAVQLRAPFEA